MSIRGAVGVIVNPAAGPGWRRRAGAADLARRFLARHQLPGTVAESEGLGHARELAQQMVDRGVGLVVARGGDGTINEVGSVLAGQDVALGIVPAGSGNGLARSLGLNLVDPQQALSTAVFGRDRQIDAGEIGGRLFFCLAGIGLDARVALAFGHTRGRGLLSYVRLTANELARNRAEDYVVSVGHETVTHEKTLLLAIANAREYGNGACIAPNAVLDDGHLNLTVVRARSLPATLLQAPRLFRGTIDHAPGVTSLEVDQVTVRGGDDILLHVDGEPFSTGPSVTAVVRPGVLKVRT